MPRRRPRPPPDDQPGEHTGTSHTPYISPWTGGSAVKAGPVADHSRFHAQNTTPNATANAAVTTISTVLHALS